MHRNPGTSKQTPVTAARSCRNTEPGCVSTRRPSRLTTKEMDWYTTRLPAPADPFYGDANIPIQDIRFSGLHPGRCFGLYLLLQHRARKAASSRPFETPSFVKVEQGARNTVPASPASSRPRRPDANMIAWRANPRNRKARPPAIVVSGMPDSIPITRRSSILPRAPRCRASRSVRRYGVRYDLAAESRSTEGAGQNHVGVISRSPRSPPDGPCRRMMSLVGSYYSFRTVRPY